jgi:hypothetical protein
MRKGVRKEEGKERIREGGEEGRKGIGQNEGKRKEGKDGIREGQGGGNRKRENERRKGSGTKEWRD